MALLFHYFFLLSLIALRHSLFEYSFFLPLRNTRAGKTRRKKTLNYGIAFEFLFRFFFFNFFFFTYILCQNIW